LDAAGFARYCDLGTTFVQIELIVFLSGAVVMILELVASRVLAPCVGSSLYVWTSLIGVVLGSLSLGYWWGGVLADRHPDRRWLSLMLLCSAMTVAGIPLVQGPLFGWLGSTMDDLRWRSLAAALVFAPPSMLLGVIPPMAARLKMTTVLRSGNTVGRLYALSTLGSILGTFAAGYWLVPFMGSTRLMLLLALVLLAASVLCAPRAFPWLRVTGLLLWTGVALARLHGQPSLSSGTLVLDRDSAYQRLLVFDLPVPQRRPVRVLSMGFEEYHSAMRLDDPDDLVLDYTRFFNLAAAYHTGIRRMLCIGGGAYSFPRHALKAWPDARIDVVEMDPDVTRIAREQFGLAADPRLAISHQDGRTFLNREGQKYDAVFLDVFQGRTIPFHLATVEAARRVAAHLTADGVLLINFMSAIEGPAGELLRAEYATLRRVFPEVLVFPVQYPAEGTRVQNLILVALRSRAGAAHPVPENLKRYLECLWTRPIESDMPPLTDDWAPVEQYAARQIAYGAK
jgi:spermidine synthase